MAWDLVFAAIELPPSEHDDSRDAIGWVPPPLARFCPSAVGARADGFQP